MAPHEWLNSLAAAGVAAFRCRRDDTGVVILERTADFFRVMHALTDHLDERHLLSELDRGWPAPGAESPLVISGTDPAWKCVVHRADEPPDTAVCIMAMPEGLDDHHDAFFTIVENLPDVVTRHDRQFRYVYVNPAIEAATGVSAEARIGKDHRETGTPEELVTTFQSIYRQVFETGEPAEAEFDYTGVSGLRHYSGWAVPEPDHDGRVNTVLAIVRDITELKRLQYELEQLAQTDPLTSLLNRRSFVDRVEPALERVRAGTGRLHMLMIDIDNFKEINDRLGHGAGDRVLEAVGRSLLTETPFPHVAARLGGDEFCVALFDVDASTVPDFVDRIAARIAQLDVGGSSDTPVRVSIGHAAADPSDGDVPHLLGRVDALMYDVKFHRARPDHEAPG
ncbi:sensor domain-containing diguanylate cyclase [Mycobacterium sp. WMMD1722]|uniref:sensor domain-containing diguanylate cyclase n=1 Tax=Mycobacterium sp. WMMD1722 TaxID=3404117 RepID=UPI003BF4B857